MNTIDRINIAYKAFQQLGAASVISYARYQFGLRTGKWKRKTAPRSPLENQQIAASIQQIAADAPQTALSLPKAEDYQKTLGESTRTLIQQAEEILNGNVRLYGAEALPIDLHPHTQLVHWTEAQKQITGDIKDIWEQARMSWAFTLARAYHLTRDERYCQCFISLFDEFCQKNPYNLGANWVSGQEVALRILALSFAWQVFHPCNLLSTEIRFKLAQAIYEHAHRIPPTLIYARAQNNNHLVVEGLGLFTAGWMLAGSPHAGEWQKQGWQIFTQALDQQIAVDGTYIQHSMNYHRLMLHAALWGYMVSKQTGSLFPKTVREKLVAAARWLLAQVDPFSGGAPNLGSNDGALILPLTTCAFRDHRPTAQAVALAFLGRTNQPHGPWNELSLWLGQALNKTQDTLLRISSPAVLRMGDAESWGTMRAARFYDRPSHADQLHVELWWKEHNIALDAGTYRYNAQSPWDNSLAGTSVHNTIQIDRADQMERAGRFLWLDWAQAEIAPKKQWNFEKLTAEHNGYDYLNVRHRRSLNRISPQVWMVEDMLEPIEADTTQHLIQLHWLLPDLPFEVYRGSITLTAPYGKIQLGLTALTRDNLQVDPTKHVWIIREGKGVYGTQNHFPILGWHSPTYSVLQPALSVLFSFKETPPVRIVSAWTFEDRSK